MRVIFIFVYILLAAPLQATDRLVLIDNSSNGFNLTIERQSNEHMYVIHKGLDSRDFILRSGITFDTSHRLLDWQVKFVHSVEDAAFSLSFGGCFQDDEKSYNAYYKNVGFKLEDLNNIRKKVELLNENVVHLPLNINDSSAYLFSYATANDRTGSVILLFTPEPIENIRSYFIAEEHSSYNYEKNVVLDFREWIGRFYGK